MLTTASIGSAYQLGIVDTGREAQFLFFVAFLVTFGFIRTSTHMIRAQVSWWPGNVETKGGLHIHHMVWGISALLVFGYLGVAVNPESPWLEIAAALVNVAKEKFGMALFALLVPLVGIIGALRLAKPNSLWAKLFYRHRKLDKSKERYAGGRGRPFWKRGPELLGRLGVRRFRGA